jgi:hypothetical protein
MSPSLLLPENLALLHDISDLSDPERPNRLCVCVYALAMCILLTVQLEAKVPSNRYGKHFLKKWRKLASLQSH